MIAEPEQVNSACAEDRFTPATNIGAKRKRGEPAATAPAPRLETVHEASVPLDA
jgi:hypothetical protein